MAGDNVIPTKPDMNIEFGVGLAMPFSSPYYNPQNGIGKGASEWMYLPEDDEPTVEQMVKMRRQDGQARALYRLVTLPIRSALRTSHFVPAEGKRGGKKEAEFIDQMFRLPASGGGMETPFDTIIAQLLQAVFDGFAAFEQVYHVPQTGPLKGKITLKKLAYRPSDTVSFLLNDKGEFDGFRQRTVFKGETVDVGIPAKDAFYFAVQEEERPFYGVSYFQSAFYHYDIKRKLYYLAHLAAQHRAVGTRYGEYPPSATQVEKAAFRSALSDFGVMQAMSFPAGFKVNTEYPAASFDFLDLINHHNSQMSKSVLASFFDESSGGQQAFVDFGQSSDELFLMALRTLMDDIAAAINARLIPKFIDWNFSSALYPKFVWGPFTDEQKSAITATFEKLATVGAGLNATPEFMFELEKYMADEMGLEIDYDTVAKEREEAKLAEAQQNGAYGQFMGQAAQQQVAAQENVAAAEQAAAQENVIAEEDVAAMSLSMQDTLDDEES